MRSGRLIEQAYFRRPGTSVANIRISSYGGAGPAICREMPGSRQVSLWHFADLLREDLLGKTWHHPLGAFAEFERSMIRERSMAGQAAARERGARIGRPRSMSERTEAAIVRMVESGAGLSAAARRYSVHLSSAKRAVLRARSEA